VFEQVLARFDDVLTPYRELYVGPTVAHGSTPWEMSTSEHPDFVWSSGCRRNPSVR
jgi:hypothetical protein